MAALVQSFPQQPGSVAMLQTRPTSSPGSHSTSSQSQHQQSLRNAQLPRNAYGGSVAIGNYRGPPVPLHAFTATPIIASNGNYNRQSQQINLRPEIRTASAPVIQPIQSQASMAAGPGARQRYPAPASVSTTSSSSSNVTSTNLSSKDDSSIPSSRRAPDVPARPLSSINLSSSASLLSTDSPTSTKPSTGRYRRPDRLPTQPAFAPPSGSGMSTVGHIYQPYVQPLPPAANPSGWNNTHQRRMASMDDMQIVRQQNSEQAKRYRRRSMSGLETGITNFSRDPQYQTPSPHPNSFIPQLPTLAVSREMRPPSDHSRPQSSHTHNGSSESVSSTRSSRPPSRRDHSGSTSSNHPPSPSSTQPKADTKPASARSSETSKRVNNPSPLSKPMAFSPVTPVEPASPKAEPLPKQEAAAAPSTEDSPAAQKLAALNHKDDKEKKKKSRLRRAFSFGSASELRRASAQNSHEKNLAASLARNAANKTPEEKEAEQEAIARRQEEGGLGESIYSGQGNFYTGSTDNLSISSTASSASIMIRKMGQGVKKSTRSLIGLFRPKSVVGVPASDCIVEPSTAQVSMVTVEAERDRVNVNVDPHDQAGGGTGFPRLERNSLDAGNPSLTNSTASVGSNRSGELRSRRSIVGGEKERAEVLAAVRKGILKRSGTDSGNSSPVTHPYDYKTPDFMLPNIPHVNDSPHSSAPSTPNDEHPPRSGHRRTDSITIEGEDYFMALTRYATDSKSAPIIPSVPRNISFSPRIQFHDTWPSGEYDRRGEIATCNRLTPMLAQQIKEELNTFKMEMEVHESSKVYTHFF